MTANTQVIHAYRHLYRNLLQAVQYARPNRFVARDQLRAAFREPGAKLDVEGVKRTQWFLQAAAKEKGLEHRILKNLLMVKSMNRSGGRKGWRAVVAANKRKCVMKFGLDGLRPPSSLRSVPADAESFAVIR